METLDFVGFVRLVAFVESFGGLDRMSEWRKEEGGWGGRKGDRRSYVWALWLLLDLLSCLHCLTALED